MAKEAWDKLSTESDEAYARFLMYRNLGPCRSVRHTYFLYLQRYDGYRGGKRGLNVPRTWREECTNNFWRARSAQWDVRNLSAYGARIVALHAEAVANIARKNLRLAKRLEPGDDGFSDLMASVRTVQSFLTPEIVEGVQKRGKPAQQPVPAATRDNG